MQYLDYCLVVDATCDSVVLVADAFWNIRHELGIQVHRYCPKRSVEGVSSDVIDSILCLLHTITLETFQKNDKITLRIVGSCDSVGKKGIAVISIILFSETKKYIFELAGGQISPRSRCIPMTMTTVHDSASGAYYREMIERLSVLDWTTLVVCREGHNLEVDVDVNHKEYVADRACQMMQSGGHGGHAREEFQVCVMHPCFVHSPLCVGLWDRPKVTRIGSMTIYIFLLPTTPTKNWRSVYIDIMSV